MLGPRIHQARLAAGLTLKALGGQAGVSHATIQKYEKGLLTPSSAMLLKLARACGVRTEYFFRTHAVTLEQAEFRCKATFGKTAQAAVKVKIAEQVEKRVELLGAFPNPPLPPFVPHADLCERIDDPAQLETMAEQLRTTWQLGMNPIADLTDTLETQGLLVIVVDETHPGFSGMTAMARTEDGRTYPVIAVSSQWPGDRQRFTLAHEVAHLLLAGRLGAEIDEEKACDRFAGAFLAPCVAVRQQLGQRRHDLEWRELLVLKHEFGLSMAGWLQRARQCAVITEAKHLAMWKRFSARGWRRQEPGEPLVAEHSSHFEQLVYRALGEQHIAETKAAELLGIPLMQFYQARQLGAGYAAAHQ